MAIYAIGDLQGCYDPLQRLLTRIHFDPADDQLWFCGDLINRGNQSLEVLRFVRSLGDMAIVVLGNHDLSFLAQIEREQAVQKMSPDLRRIVSAEDAQELTDWMRTRPLMHVDDEQGFVLVHAGLDPRWTVATAREEAAHVESLLRGPNYRGLFARMYGNKPAAWSPKLKQIERARASVNVFTRIRYCKPDGQIAFNEKGRPGSQSAGLYPWFEVPGQVTREHRVVFGHWSSLGLFQGMGVYGTDTGCVWGGHLTALRLGRFPSFIQVKAKPD